MAEGADYVADAHCGDGFDLGRGGEYVEGLFGGGVEGDGGRGTGVSVGLWALSVGAVWEGVLLLWGAWVGLGKGDWVGAEDRPTRCGLRASCLPVRMTRWFATWQRSSYAVV